MMMTLKYTQFQHSPPIGHRTQAGEGAAQHQRGQYRGLGKEDRRALVRVGKAVGCLVSSHRQTKGSLAARLGGGIQYAYQTERKRSKLTSCKAGIIHTARTCRVIPCRVRPVNTARYNLSVFFKCVHTLDEDREVETSCNTVPCD